MNNFSLHISYLLLSFSISLPFNFTLCLKLTSSLIFLFLYELFMILKWSFISKLVNIDNSWTLKFCKSPSVIKLPLFKLPFLWAHLRQTSKPFRSTPFLSLLPALPILIFDAHACPNVHWWLLGLSYFEWNSIIWSKTKRWGTYVERDSCSSGKIHLRDFLNQV